MSLCPYPRKRSFYTRELARTGARQIEFSITERGGTYTQLYPYRCPSDKHWHLSSSRQGNRACPCCDALVPAWFNKTGGTWVVFAHDYCATQAVRDG